MKTLRIISIACSLVGVALCGVGLASAQAQVVQPPTEDLDDRRFELTAPVKGTEPFTYQWYRKSGTKTVALPAPEGVQKTLLLQPPYVAGIYWCMVTNPAGTLHGRECRIAITKSLTALPLVVTIEQP